ncbi:MAG TPA: ATP-binding protein [Thermomicrobiales bacterium]|nr:ATP-binding protein [Thermomicrobiales bacterium]
MLGAGPGEVIGNWDADQLGQILDNLLGNAIKYSPEGGTIDLVLASDGEVARLSIRDEGIGVPAAVRARIFDQFFRAPNARSGGDHSHIEGLGLGLFNAQHLARRHGGMIEVESMEGLGSIFQLILPLNPNDSDISTEETEAPDDGTP